MTRSELKGHKQNKYQSNLVNIVKTTVRMRKHPSQAVRWSTKKITQVMERDPNPPARDIKFWAKKMPRVLTDLMKVRVEGAQVCGAIVNSKGMKLKQMPKNQAEALVCIAGRGRGRKTAGVVLSSDPNGALLLAYARTQIEKGRGLIKPQIENVNEAKPMLTEPAVLEFVTSTPEFAAVVHPSASLTAPAVFRLTARPEEAEAAYAAAS